MKKCVLFLLIFFLVACKPAKKSKQTMKEVKANELKERSPVIEKVASFINLNLEISPFSKDSIVVRLTFRNNGDKEFKLYKPLLPYNNMTEDLFSILEKKS